MLRLLLFSAMFLILLSLCSVTGALTTASTQQPPTSFNPTKIVSTPDPQKGIIVTSTSRKSPGGGNISPLPCTATPAPTPIPTSQREFHNDRVTFHYPDSWRTMKEVFGFDQGTAKDRDFNGELMIQVINNQPSSYGEKYTAWCKVVQKELPAGEKLEDLVNESYDILKNYQNPEISQGPVAVNGLAGIEKVYRCPRGEPWYQVRDTWLEKNNQVYIVSCWAIPTIYDKSQDEFNLILQTLQIK